jgi:RimJ/RimL family protein N-acetyltransferase
VTGPAYRIETERLLVRCLEPTDAAAMNAAVEASLDHLRPWMPWAMGDVPTFDERVGWLRSMRGAFDLDQDYPYGVFDPTGREVLGASGLHTRAGEGAREIGYWVHVDHVGRGYATELAAALTKVAFEVSGVDRVEIRCDPRNVRSAAVPRKLGYALEATLRRRTTDTHGAPRDTMLFGLFADTYPGTPASRAQLRAFDAAGRRLL